MGSQQVYDPADLWDKDIFTLLGLENAPEDKKKEILDNMTKTINNRVMARVLDMLDDESLKTFDQLLGTNDDQQINDFLKSKEVDLMEVTAQEALLYKTEILNLGKADDNAAKE